MKLIFLDTETGGVDPRANSLLSIGLVIWENKKIITEKEFLVKEKNYNVTAQAMEINKINLDELKKKGLEKSEKKKLQI